MYLQLGDRGYLYRLWLALLRISCWVAGTRNNATTCCATNSQEDDDSCGGYENNDASGTTHEQPRPDAASFARAGVMPGLRRTLPGLRDRRAAPGALDRDGGYMVWVLSLFVVPIVVHSCLVSAHQLSSHENLFCYQYYE